VNIEIRNVLGQLLYSRMTQDAKSTTEIEVSNLPKGIYIIEVRNK